MQYKSKQKIDPKNEKSVHPLKSANAMNKKKNILNWTGKKMHETSSSTSWLYLVQAPKKSITWENLLGMTFCRCFCLFAWISEQSLSTKLMYSYD